MWYDCGTCGACCTNPPENVREGRVDYVKVEPDDPVFRKKDLRRKLVVLGDDGEAHLRLTPDGRCAALHGALGASVRCSIYHHRPAACRRVEPGGKLCLWYRAEHGLEDPA